MSDPNVVNVLKQIIERINSRLPDARLWAIGRLADSALPIAKREAEERDSLHARVVALEGCLREITNFCERCGLHAGSTSECIHRFAVATLADGATPSAPNSTVPKIDYQAPAGNPHLAELFKSWDRKKRDGVVERIVSESNKPRLSRSK